MSQERNALARGGSLSFLGSALSAVLGFVLTIMLARGLGDAGVGVVFQAMSVFVIALALCKCGMDSTAVWILPRAAITDRTVIPGILLQMMLIVVCISTLATAALLLAAPMLWRESPEVVSAVRAVAWFLPPAALMLLVVAALRALGNVRIYVLLGSIALPALRLPSAMIVVGLGGSAALVSAAWAAPAVLVLIVAWVVLRRVLRSHSPDRGRTSVADRESLGRIIRFAVPRTASAGMEQATIWLGVLLVGFLAGPAAAGVYGGASRFVQAGLIIDSAIRVVVSPRFSTMLHTEDLGGVRRLYGMAAAWLVLFASPIYILLAFFAPVALAILGPEFSEGVAALVVLCIGAIVTFLAGTVHSVLLMSGHSGWAAFNKGVVLVITVVGTMLLVPHIGFMGAAVTWAVSMGVDALLAVIQVRLLVGVSVQPTQVLLPLAIALGTVGLSSAVVVWWIGATVGGLVLAVAVGGALFAGACALFRKELHLQGASSIFSRPRSR